MHGGSGLFAARQLASQPVDFLALLVGHVLLRYEVTIRTYGALSTTFRKRVGWVEAPPVKEPPAEAYAPLPSAPPGPGLQARSAEPPTLPPPRDPQGPSEEETAFRKKRRRDWAKLIAKVYYDDPCLCSSCGQPMKIVAAITSPAQDEVIERVLRHLHRWDPPWKRPRRARGPPDERRDSPGSQEALANPAEPIDPLPLDAEYCIDPPSSGDP
ncbi:MAG: hypothetical protein HY721_04425 [Planctomycetes bacterium]|nr:hypothetical protein [Planctomycetota bacterium]